MKHSIPFLDAINKKINRLIAVTIVTFIFSLIGSIAVVQNITYRAEIKNLEKDKDSINERLEFYQNFYIQKMSEPKATEEKKETDSLTRKQVRFYSDENGILFL